MYVYRDYVLFMNVSKNKENASALLHFKEKIGKKREPR